LTVARPLSDILDEAHSAVHAGVTYSATPWPTGFTPLDRELSGGLRAGELVIVGGAQGLGKTTFALQLARNVVAAGGSAVYLCYEHDERILLQKLLAMEAGYAEPEDGATLTQVSDALQAGGRAGLGLDDRLAHLPGAAAALSRLRSYGDRLRLVTGSGRSTGAQEIREIIRPLAGSGILVVDYLQKVSTPGPPTAEDERVTTVVAALKDIAMDFAMPVVALCAADRDGIGEGRTRLAHMRGSTAIAYEADIALMLNDKWHAVARHHLMYAGAGAGRYHDWVVCTVEKNRAGRPGADLEFRKRFSQSRFDPHGQVVREELIDDRVFRE
jgi:replicative DNA helicase